MRWVHKQNFAFILAVLVPVVIGVGVVTNNPLEEVLVAPVVVAPELPTIICFDVDSRITITLTESTCPQDFSS